MKRIILPFLIAAWTGTGAAAQVSGNYQYNNPQGYQQPPRNAASSAAIQDNNTVTVEINGLMNIVADHYVAQFNLVQVGETMDATNGFMNDRISGFMRALRGIGVDTSGVKVDVISFVPRYEYQTESKLFSKTYNEVPAGFELQKNVLVTYRNSAKLDDILTAAAAAEIYDLMKVDYFVPNIQKSRDSLRMKCLQAVKAKVDAYNLIGFRLDTSRKAIADNFSTVYPQTRYFNYTAFSRPSLNAAKKKAFTQTSVNEAQKSISRYYNPVEYDRYDLVLNPVVNEPVVQLSYSVTVRYFLKEEAPQKHLYYYMTPAGEMRQFDPK